MDTRYWGPSGWKLLHTISFTFNEKKKNEYNDFFTSIAYVLPCKFCRKSYSEYLIEDPIENSLTSKENFTKWLYRIHNKVNDKLRKQGLCTSINPQFSIVKKIYEEKIQQGCSKVHFEGWEFLFSIIEGHPLSKLSLSSKPFNHENIIINTPLLQNQYNMMEPNKRMKYFKNFWSLLPEVLPFEEWTILWKKFDSDQYDTRASLLKNIFKIRCSLEDALELENKTKFSSLCKELRTYKSGCNKSTRSKTCRSQRQKRK